MAHRYAQPITPRPAMADATSPPDGFTWRDQTYTVRAVLARWHLEARWWEALTPSAAPPTAALGAAPEGSPGDTLGGPHAASDRFYYRLACAPDLLCEVYCDACVGQWVLDVVYD